jgi:hypothetical protein
MATGRKTQLTRQIGEHLVAAELGRRGLIATPFAGNVPDFDLLVANDEGQAMPIQVKAINGGDWQFDVKKYLRIELVGTKQYVRGAIPLANPGLVCVFVLLRESRNDEFYIFHLRDLQKIFCQVYTDRERPKNPESTHCKISPKQLTTHRDRWEVITQSLLALT